MRDRRLATRYAGALLASAGRDGDLAAVAESYAAVRELLARRPDLVSFLQGPQVAEAEKRGLLRTLFGLDPVRGGQVTVGASSGPASPAARRASAARAASSAPSASTVTNALRAGLIRAIRSSSACVSSTLLMSPAPSARESWAMVAPGAGPLAG